MIWFALGIAIIAVVFILRAHNSAEVVPEPQPIPDKKAVPDGGAAFLTGVVTEEDEYELLAVITAAIAEFEGDNDFQVASITRRSNNWKLTGYQESVSSRLN